MSALKVAIDLALKCTVHLREIIYLDLKVYTFFQSVLSSSGLTQSQKKFIHSDLNIYFH